MFSALSKLAVCVVTLASSHLQSSDLGTWERCIWLLALLMLDAFAPLKRPSPGGQAQYGPKGCAWGIQKTFCALELALAPES